jgi:hypothetical protein
MIHSYKNQLAEQKLSLEEESQWEKSANRNATKHETELLRQHLKREEDLQMLH